MKTIKTVLLFFLFGHCLNAQSIIDSLDWVKAVNDKGLSGLNIETDEEDHIFMAGQYEACLACFIMIDSDTLYQAGNDKRTIFLAQLDQNGELVNSMLFGGDNHVLLSAFEIDHDGQLILLIRSFGEFEISNTILDRGYYLLKLNQNFELIWQLNLKGSRHLNAFYMSGNLKEQISVDQSNDIVVGGSIGQSFDFNVIVDTIIDVWGDTVPQYLVKYDTLMIGEESFTVDTNNIFIAKISTAGNLEWLKTFESNGTVSLSSIDATDSQEINVLGLMTKEDWIVGMDTLRIDTSRADYARNVFVLKMDAQGNPIWARRYFEHLHHANAINLDNDGNLILTGVFNVLTYFNQDTIFSTGLASDIILLKIDPTGNLLWAKAAGDETSNSSGEAITNNENEIYLSGELSSSLGMIMNKFHPSGDLIWSLNPVHVFNREGGSLTFDHSGNLIQTGVYTGNFIIGDYELQSTNSAWEQFILKFRNQSSVITTGINELESISNQQVLISPNPTTAEIELQTNGLTVFSLKLFDLKGQLLWQDQEQFIQTKKLDFSFLNNGLYLLQLQTSSGIVSKKLLLLK